MELLQPKKEIKLVGKHLILTPITYNQINDDYIMWLNNTETNKYLEIRFKEQTKENVITYINNLRNQNVCDLFAIVRNDKLVGTMGISFYDENNKVSEFGILIGDTESRKAGIGGEAMILMIDYLFTHTDTEYIQLKSVEINKPSIDLITSIGFKQVGVLPKYCVINETYRVNMNLYALLRPEWKKIKTKYGFVLK